MWLHETSLFLFIFSAVGLQKNLALIKQPLALLSQLGWKNTSEGLAKHFNESQANALFRNPKRIIYRALLPLVKVVVLHDDDNLSVLKSDYFICIWFGYLTLCYDDTSIIKPYCLDRFSRQFGFCQHIPYDFGRRTGIPTLKDVFQLWHNFTKLNTHSPYKLLLPPSTRLPLMTKLYMDWWILEWSKVCPPEMKVIFKSPTDVATVFPGAKEKKEWP